jgi:hypothetical protein
MNSNLDVLEKDMALNPCLIDQLFERHFSISELIQGAEDAGYEIGEAERTALGESMRTASTEAVVKFRVHKLPDSREVTAITDLEEEEIEFVAAGYLDYSDYRPEDYWIYSNIYVAALVAVVAAAAVIVIVMVA